MLESDTEYYWRVDAILENEEIILGDIWKFKTESDNIEIN